MMGRLKSDQGQLFYSFCLDDVVPHDHRVRAIAAVLDLSWVHSQLAPHYSHLGRPSIDPVLMIRILITRENAEMVRNLGLDAQAAEPPVCQINLHFATQQPLRADGEHIANGSEKYARSGRRTHTRAIKAARYPLQRVITQPRPSTDIDVGTRVPAAATA
jgi:hypothetical protein